MSIKKLFDSANKNKNYTDYQTEKEAYESVESADNAEQLAIKQQKFEPHLDYSNPANFARFGSAYYYYKGAMERISDFYPYDGSEAEKNKFYNGLLPVERYIFENKYPRFTGYANFTDITYNASPLTNGWTDPASSDDQQYITFKGGPNTGSAGSSLAAMSPNPYSDAFNHSNIYDEDIYETAGLPSDYGTGTRQSNLKANFDTGVTVEFWMKTGSFDRTRGTKRAVFDWWNNNASSSADYGRIQIIASASSHDGTKPKPFYITVQSGAAVNSDDYYKIPLGQLSLTSSMGNWNHYAVRLYNSGSTLNAKLYVNGKFNDSNVLKPYTLTSKLSMFTSSLRAQNDYISHDNLELWHKLNDTPSYTGGVTDYSGKGRNSAYTDVLDVPSIGTTTPSEYIQKTSYDFDGSKNRIYIGPSETWQSIIGTAGGSKKMSFSFRIKPHAIGTQKGILSFGSNLVIYLSNAGAAADYKVVIYTKWNGGSTVNWQANSMEANLNEWAHFTITYDARSHLNDPILYMNGVSQTLTEAGTAPAGTWDGTGISQANIGRISTVSSYYEGEIADFGIWSSLLTSEEVAALYQAQVHQNAFNGITELNSNSAMGRIGALLHENTGVPNTSTTAGPGQGVLSASIDEFRFWKADRNSELIGRNWNCSVGGGANTDIANADLGVYFKFNEGIVGDESVDSIVLDYAGRVSNGVWNSYSSTSSRNTGSAMLSASATLYEYEEPVVRTNHPEYISIKDSLLETGSFYDSNNNSTFVNYMPHWILEEDEKIGNENLKIMSHVMGTYFDKLYNLTQELPSLRHTAYTTASAAPVPFASHLPQSLGLYVPEIFTDASILENLYNKNDNREFEGKLKETKDLIYQNLYTNLTNIYKSKGTEKAFRNVLRCFNIDDDLIKFKSYSTNAVYEIKDNLRQVLKTDKLANFNTYDNKSATIYQRSSSANEQSRGFISGTYGGNALDPASTLKYEQNYGMTVESEIVFPKFFKQKDLVGRKFLEVSLFGLHTVKTSSQIYLDGVKTTWVPLGDDKANFQVTAVRDEEDSKNVYFKLQSRRTPSHFPTLTSSLYFSVYDNEKWNISVRLRPKNYGFSGFVSGATTTDLAAPFNYVLEFAGHSTQLGVETNSFILTSSVGFEAGSNFLTSPKRIYVGAYRENYTGSAIYESDVEISNIKYWTKYLETPNLIKHANELDNSGISGSANSISALDKATKNYDIKNSDSLALEWNFDNIYGVTSAVTGTSDADGTFRLQDFSSGSATKRSEYGVQGRVVGAQHTGRGFGFTTSSSDVIKNKRVNAFKFINPEENVSSNMINLVNDTDRLYNRTETIPNYLFVLEKSMYEAVSEEMLKFLAGAADFNDLIGNPVNRYRERYKAIEKLRETFFLRVDSVSTVERFVKYYKWFDDSLSTIFSQLTPASVEYIEDVANIIESHVLERPKYKTKFPTLEFKGHEPDAVIKSFGEISYRYPRGFSTLPQSPRRTDKHLLYWKERAERDAPEITSGDAAIDAEREKIREVVTSAPTLTSSSPVIRDRSGQRYHANEFARRSFGKSYRFSIDKPNYRTIKGGTNFSPDKSIMFTRAALYPGGPINTDNNVFIPRNILLSFVNDFYSITDFKDPSDNPIEKIKRVVKVLHGRNYEHGLSYSTLKSSKAFPFNIVSSSLSSGYQSYIKSRLGFNVEIVNVHNDVYGDDMERPMQGPFTEHNVGGLQSRHIAVNRGTDNEQSRPEAWRIELGVCVQNLTGAIGMVGADYPPPDYVAPAGAKPYPYPHFPKAVHYRDFIAKRPVNIRNIRITGSDVLGNYRETYDVVSTFGAHSNPRQFVENTPTLPANTFQNNTTGATSVRTFLDIRSNRTFNSLEHFDFVQDYNVSYLTGTTNKSVIKTKFSAPGGTEIMTPGYTDFRSDEFSVYNALPFKNLTVIKPYQGPSGTLAKVDAASNSNVGIRVNDIHDESYGLRSHLARHTARFGRDSLHVRTSPGETYNELPGFHKVHRNNLTRYKPLYGFVDKVTSQFVNNKFLQWPSKNISNGNGNIAIIENATKRTERVFDALYADSNNKQVSFTWQAWIRNVTQGTAAILMSLGRGSRDDATNPRPVHELSRDSAGKLAYKLYTRNDAGTLQTRVTWQTTAILTGSGFTHLVLTFSGSQGELGNAPPGGTKRQVGIYLDGVRYIAQDQNPTSGPQPYFQTSSVGISNFRGHGGDLSDPISFFGNPTAPTSNEFYGDVDQMAMWNTALTPAQVTEIYNSGIPCNLTSSGTAGRENLLSWWRMGETAGDGTQGSGSASSMTMAAGVNKMVDVANGADLLLTAQQGQLLLISTASSNDRGAALGGCTISTKQYEITGYSSNEEYDNFFVNRQIPRSTKQYRWISDSLINSNNHIGFVPTDFKIDSGSTRINAYDFVTASDFGSYQAGANREFGVPKSAGASQFIAQVEKLNLNIYEPVIVESNTLGYKDGSEYILRDYGNTSIITPPIAVNEQAELFNSLMIKRNGTYGYPSWKRNRAATESPVIINEKRNNLLSVLKAPESGQVSGTIASYSMPPVDLTSRVQYVSLQHDNGSNYEFAASHEPRFFNSYDLDNQTNVGMSPVITPLETILVNTYRSVGFNKFNWLLYRESLFPSHRNHFASHSTKRENYKNRFWNSDRIVRNTVDAKFNRDPEPVTPTEFTLPPNNWTRFNTFGRQVSASSWVLDAQTDFLTRTEPAAWPKSTYIGTEAPDSSRNPRPCEIWRATGSAGELQTHYQSYFISTMANDQFGSGSYPAAPYWTSFNRIMNAIPGALYARKHMLGSPQSVAAPTSILTEAGRLKAPGGNVGGGHAKQPFETAAQVEVFGGEALWEAHNHAGYLKNNLSGGFDFISSPSKPFYDSYDDFAETLKYLDRGYSIVPEFRISRNLFDYIDYGSPLVPEKTDHFDVPGTIFSSSRDTFYVDYSNSEFLRHFKQIKDESGLSPHSLRLVCSASIKFHPYKGFYPAQRTVDLVNQFKKSYGPTVTAITVTGSRAGRKGSTEMFGGLEAIEKLPGALRPVCQPLFAPGILYNSIKSGIAVDFPVLYNKTKMKSRGNYTETTDHQVLKNTHQDYVITVNGDYDQFSRQMQGDSLAQQPLGAFWDDRVDFRSIIDPNLVAGMPFVDMEPHPSASLLASASIGPTSDPTYKLMAKNFFGGVIDFFIENSSMTKLESEPIAKNDFVFSDNDVYMARIKLRRSVTGSRVYTFESGSFSDYAYSRLGGTAFYANLSPALPLGTAPKYQRGLYYELPQDPKYAPNFKETLTMYSRPSAFGPPVAGAYGWYTTGFKGAGPYTGSYYRSGSSYQIMDSFTGYNWSFTPPYYNGEAWVDLIFRPTHSVSYDLERILAETRTVCWRVDPGPKVKLTDSGTIGNHEPQARGIMDSPKGWTSLIYDPSNAFGQNRGEVPMAPYAGRVINDNAMQVTSSVDIFGVENVYRQTKDNFGLAVDSQNEVLAKKWIIQPKWESPVLNFSDFHGAQPVTSSAGTKTLPIFASASVPNGMWHQFGTLPTDGNTGIFLEIDDMSKNWLRNHYLVRLSGSVYNAGTPDYSGSLVNNVKSLADLCKFNDKNRSKRIGQLKDKLTVKEAVVAIPYIIYDDVPSSLENSVVTLQSGKSFIKLPTDRVNATLEELSNTTVGTSLEVAGLSIRKQIENMKNYILPPHFDFLTNQTVVPIVMYFFEFEHQFDKNDLSYMWQNMMPRDYDKISLKTATTAHTLNDNELFNSELLESENLRWMVFKVKQRVQSNYYELLPDNASAQNTQQTQTPQEKYMQFNWPYDFFSIIESIKIDGEFLFREPVDNSNKPVFKYGGSVGGNSANNNSSTAQTIDSSNIAGTNAAPAAEQIDNTGNQIGAPSTGIGGSSTGGGGQY